MKGVLRIDIGMFTLPAADSLVGVIVDTMSPPDNFRKLLTSISIAEDASKLADWSAQFDWSLVSATQIYCSLLGRRPESISGIYLHEREEPKDIFFRTLMSGEFQMKVIGRILDSFPEKKRIFFIHIPKCSGNSVGKRFESRFSCLQHTIQDGRFVDGLELFKTLSSFARVVGESPAIFLWGHRTIEELYRENQIRFGDTIFAVLRDPIDIAISQANYVASLMLVEGPQRPDVSVWMDHLGMRVLPEPDDQSAWVAIAASALLNEGTNPSNPITSYLGDGTCMGALENVARFDVELTDVAKCDNWLADRWGFPDVAFENVSTKFLSRNSLSSEDVSRLSLRFAEDLDFFKLYSDSINRAGTASISGYDFAKEAFVEKGVWS